MLERKVNIQRYIDTKPPYTVKSVIWWSLERFDCSAKTSKHDLKNEFRDIQTSHRHLSPSATTCLSVLQVGATVYNDELERTC